MTRVFYSDYFLTIEKGKQPEVANGIMRQPEVGREQLGDSESEIRNPESEKSPYHCPLNPHSRFNSFTHSLHSPIHTFTQTWIAYTKPSSKSCWPESPSSKYCCAQGWCCQDFRWQRKSDVLSWGMAPP
jgi:hypothetical protein